MNGCNRSQIKPEIKASDKHIGEFAINTISAIIIIMEIMAIAAILFKLSDVILSPVYIRHLEFQMW
jgi:hypothetical protein